MQGFDPVASGNGASDNKIDIQFVSKNKIAADFQKKSNENYEELLGENNPFKNLLVLGVKEDFKNAEGFSRIAKQIKVVPGVFEVSYPSLYVSLLIVKIKLSAEATQFKCCTNSISAPT